MQRLDYSGINKEEETTQKQADYSEEDCRRYKKYTVIVAICAAIILTLLMLFQEFV